MQKQIMVYVLCMSVAQISFALAAVLSVMLVIALSLIGSGQLSLSDFAPGYIKSGVIWCFVLAGINYMSFMASQSVKGKLKNNEE